MVHPHLPADVVARIRAVFVGMAADASAADILRAAKCPGFALADDADFARVRAVYREAAE